MADSSVFFTSLATRLREKVRSASARSTFLPRISSASRLSFCGLTRMSRVTALASLSLSARSRCGLPISLRLRRGGRRRRSLRLAVCGMAVERPRRRELTEFVADHVLGYEHRDMLLAVVHAEGQPNELRQDGRTARPDLDHRVRAGAARLLRLLQQISVDERTFPNRATHVSYPFF